MARPDGTVVNVALPQIQQALHAGAAEVQVMNAYLLLLGACSCSAVSGDRYGRHVPGRRRLHRGVDRVRSA